MFLSSSALCCVGLVASFHPFIDVRKLGPGILLSVVGSSRLWNHGRSVFLLLEARSAYWKFCLVHTCSTWLELGRSVTYQLRPTWLTFLASAGVTFKFSQPLLSFLMKL